MESNSDEFEALVVRHRAELRAYCYRMLGSLQDAEDALQEALLGAFRGYAGFAGRSSARTWLYRIATHACLRIIEQRPRRLLSEQYAPSALGVDLAARVDGPVWLEPYPTPSDASYEQRESVELAFVAALQHLPAIQRASLILHDVLGFQASEAADQLDTSVAAVNSALQRARDAVRERIPRVSQQATLRNLGDQAQRELVESYIDAWRTGDVAVLIDLLANDVKFSMPPIPTWFDGRDAVARFFAERVFATPWRLEPIPVNGQLGFACYQGPDFRLGAINVVTLRDHSICALTGFLDPALHAHFWLGPR